MLETRTWCSALGLLIAMGCTSHHMSTETGNPPVIDSSKIALVVTRDEVHVRGEAGAIMPPEASVEVTIVRTDDVTLDSVADDGSFDVEVDATLDDVFEVRAVLGDLRSDVVIVDRGGAMVVGGDGGSSGGSGGGGGASGMGGSGGSGGPLSCEEQESLGQAELDAALAMADRSCDVDADCMGFYRSTACFASCFGGFFSAEGLEQLQDAVTEIDEGVCSTFEEDGCELIVPPCLPPGEGFCVAGQCSEERVGGACEQCLDAEIWWLALDPGVFPAEVDTTPHTLNGCNSYSRPVSGKLCEVSIPQCVTGGALVSVEDLNALIATPEVQAALADGGEQGEGAMGGYRYELTIGGRTFHYRTCSGVAGVECLPDNPIEQLLARLNELSQQHSCPPGDECTADFEVGECDAAIPRWWHNPDTGVCGHRTYGGCGGNANNYASLEECQAACPPPVDQGDCGEGRQLGEVCVECGLGGGCRASVSACELECSSNADCEDELGAFEGGSFCNLPTGICETNLICI